LRATGGRDASGLFVVRREGSTFAHQPQLKLLIKKESRNRAVKKDGRLRRDSLGGFIVEKATGGCKHATKDAVRTEEIGAGRDHCCRPRAGPCPRIKGIRSMTLELVRVRRWLRRRWGEDHWAHLFLFSAEIRISPWSCGRVRGVQGGEVNCETSGLPKRVGCRAAGRMTGQAGP